MARNKEALLRECRVLNALKNRFGDHCFVRTIHDSLVESGNGTLLNQGGGAISDRWSGIVLERGMHSLRQRMSTAIDATSALTLVENVTDALVLLEQFGLVHMDIKPENIVSFDHAMDRRWKLIDFDSAVNRGEALNSKQVFTAAYCAPEVARLVISSHPLQAQCTMDTWSLGMIVLELHLRQSYWQQRRIETQQDMLTHLSSLNDATMRAYIETVDNPKVRSFLQSALCVTGRFTASQLKNKTLFNWAADSSVSVEKMRQRERENALMLRLLHSIEAKVTSIGVGVDNTLGQLAVLSVDQSSALSSLSSLSSSYQTMVGALTQLTQKPSLSSKDIDMCLSDMQTRLSDTLSTIMAGIVEEQVSAQSEALKKVLEQDRDRMAGYMASLKQDLSRGHLSQAEAKLKLDRILTDVQLVNEQTGHLLRLSQDLHCDHTLLLSSMDKLKSDMFLSQRETKQAVLDQLRETEGCLRTGVSAVESRLQAGLEVSLLPALLSHLKGVVEDACSRCSHSLLSDTQATLLNMSSLLADQASSASQSGPALLTILSTLSSMSSDLMQVKEAVQEMSLTLSSAQSSLHTALDALKSDMLNATSKHGSLSPVRSTGWRVF